MSIRKKLFSNTISNGLQFGSRWIMNILLAQNTTIATFGIFSFIYTIATLIATFFTFGSNLYMLNKIKEHKESSLSHLYTSIGISILFFSVILLLLFSFNFFISIDSLYSDYFPYAFVLAFVWSVNINIFYFFKALGLFEKEAVAYFVFSILLLSFLIVASWLNIFNTLELKWILISLILLNAIPTVIGIIHLKSLYSLSINSVIQNIKTSLLEVQDSIKHRFSYGIHEFQSILYTNLPFLMIGTFMTANDLGQYRAIYILIVPLLILPVIISQVLLNQLTQTKTDATVFKKTFRKISLYTVLIGFLIMIFYFFFGKYILDTIYNEKFNFESSVSLLTIFVLTAFLWFIKSNYEVLLTSLGKQWLRVKVLWASLVIFPFLVYIFPSNLGVIRYAYAGLITIFFMLMIYIWIAEIRLRKYEK